MTPNDIIDAAKDAVFPVLCLDDDPAFFVRLLRQSLDKYQHKAGLILTAVHPDDVAATKIPIPENCLSVARAADKAGNWHEVAEVDGYFVVAPRCNSRPPFTVHYFADLHGFDIAQYLHDTWEQGMEYTAYEDAVRTPSGVAFLCIGSHETTEADTAPEPDDFDDTKWNIYNTIPRVAVALIREHLTAQIDIPNTRRARTAMQTMAVQSDLPDEAAMFERLKATEEAMEEQGFLYINSVL